MSLPCAFPELADRRYDGEVLLAALEPLVDRLVMDHDNRSKMRLSTRELRVVLDGLPGDTLQERWSAFEWRVWPDWLRGVGRAPHDRWTFGVCLLMISQAARPSWSFLECTYTRAWVKRLPPEAPLQAAAGRLTPALESVSWATKALREKALKNGLRILMVGGYSQLEQITDEDLRAVPVVVGSGSDVLDAALCSLGVLGRTPLRGAARRMRSRRLTPAELAERSRIPERFRPAHVLYLEVYQDRISNVYATTRHKHNSLEHFWCFIDERFPEVGGCSEIRPAHARAYIPEAIALARRVQRGPRAGEREDRSTAMQWLTNIRCFFADVCTWGAEEGSPFEQHAPAAVPLERHDLRNIGFEKVRRRAQAQTAEKVIDLEREIPKMRALAIRRWDDAEQALNAAPPTRATRIGETEAFWDWAVLELLLQSGLRIEEASELTTLDVLRRRHPDGRTYYMLHVKPSKFDRARVIPIGDGLGRVIAEIIRHVKAFYGTDRVPDCDHYDASEKRALPRAPVSAAGLPAPEPGRVRGDPHAPGPPLASRGAAPRGRFGAGRAPARLPARVRVRASEQQHAGARDPGAARARVDRHGDGLRQALPLNPGRGVPKDRPCRLRRPPRHRRAAQPDRRGMGRVPGQLRDARHGHPPVRAPDRRALRPRTGLPRVRARATEAERSTGLPADARQPPPQPLGCA